METNSTEMERKHEIRSVPTGVITEILSGRDDMVSGACGVSALCGNHDRDLHAAWRDAVPDVGISEGYIDRVYVEYAVSDGRPVLHAEVYKLYGGQKDKVGIRSSEVSAGFPRTATIFYYEKGCQAVRLSHRCYDMLSDSICSRVHAYFFCYEYYSASRCEPTSSGIVCLAVYVVSRQVSSCLHCIIT